MSSQKKLTIAIDGYSSCGKSTLAKALAKQLNYTFVDSGAMYRGVALYCLRHDFISNGIPSVDKIVDTLNKISIQFERSPSNGQQELILNGENVELEIRSPEVAAVVSQIAAIAAVRTKLVDEQRMMGKKGGVVMDGRDIGSVVFPAAEVKFFVTADPDIRAKRRFTELKAKGLDVDLAEIKRNLLERDHIDSTRVESPLTRTKDAILLDNSFMNQEEQLVFALNHVTRIEKEINKNDIYC